MELTTEDEGQRIAILSYSGRFPGAGEVEQYWENLRAGRESVTFFSDEELRRAGVGQELLEDPSYVKAHRIVTNCDQFDAGFFGFTPKEAEVSDPQHRLFLECCWEALESAGYEPQAFPGRIGVFASQAQSMYLVDSALWRQYRSLGVLQLRIGSEKDHLPLRVSYKLNLKGPSVAVQTACSSSLVAVHMACQSLLSGECEMALAGGVRISLPQERGYLYQRGGIASPDGHCRAFDAEARGTVGGNGAGVVVLKRLSEAERDGDTIRAVILGSAVNSDRSV